MPKCILINQLGRHEKRNAVIRLYCLQLKSVADLGPMIIGGKICVLSSIIFLRTRSLQFGCYYHIVFVVLVM
jgi:hypothetical protein